MRLAFSNIAWDAAENDAVLALLGRRGVGGAEIAPTKVWPGWGGATQQAAAAERIRLSDRGLAVPALQSILFGRPDLQVFGSQETRDAALAHLTLVAQLAASLGARVLVFGSPKNRLRGTLDTAEANRRAVAFFRLAGDVCAPWNVDLCLEPNPEAYQCDFLTHWQEVREIVREIAHPSVGIHLDSACIALAGDDPAEAVRACAGEMRHFHISEPHLADFSAPTIDHATIGAALAEIGYAGWISVEMRRTDDPLRSIGEAVSRAREWYHPA